MVAVLHPKQPTHRPAVSSKQTHVRLSIVTSDGKSAVSCAGFTILPMIGHGRTTPCVSMPEMSIEGRAHPHAHKHEIAGAKPTANKMDGPFKRLPFETAVNGLTPATILGGSPRWKGGIDRFARCRTSALITSREGYATGIQLSIYE
jgi:hypothetical protein